MKIGQLPVVNQRQFPNKVSQLLFLHPRNFRSLKFCDFQNYNHLNRFEAYAAVFNSVSSDHNIPGEKPTQ